MPNLFKLPDNSVIDLDKIMRVSPLYRDTESPRFFIRLYATGFSSDFFHLVELSSYTDVYDAATAKTRAAEIRDEIISSWGDNAQNKKALRQ